MQPNNDAIRTWLWMKAMDQACEDIWRHCKFYAVPSEKDRQFMKFDDLVEKSYRYALNHWHEAIQSAYSHGAGSSESHYSTGYSIDGDSRGVTAEFRELSMTVTYNEVKRFIERLLTPPTMEERQMTMLEILSMGAQP
jgi:hypothetical protein